MIPSPFFLHFFSRIYCGLLPLRANRQFVMDSLIDSWSSGLGFNFLVADHPRLSGCCRPQFDACVRDNTKTMDTCTTTLFDHNSGALRKEIPSKGLAE
jgi:hypothetical protein